MPVPERPPSLLTRRPIEGPALTYGFIAAVCAHILVPALVMGSQWLLVLLGLAIPVGEVKNEIPKTVIAAEFVKLGKPLDPKKLPQRKVPPIAERKTDAITVSKDPKEPPPEVKKEEKKEKPPDYKPSLLDNLVDRTRDFAEAVKTEEEGDPNGIREGTAKTAKEGNIYLGQLSIFFRRNWAVPNVVKNPEKMEGYAAVAVGNDGRIRSVEVDKSSGDAYFDQAMVDSVTMLIQNGATLPEPPEEIRGDYYGKTLSIRFRGADAR